MPSDEIFSLAKTLCRSAGEKGYGAIIILVDDLEVHSCCNLPRKLNAGMAMRAALTLAKEAGETNEEPNE